MEISFSDLKKIVDSFIVTDCPCVAAFFASELNQPPPQLTLFNQLIVQPLYKSTSSYYVIYGRPKLFL